MLAITGKAAPPTVTAVRAPLSVHLVKGVALGTATSTRPAEVTPIHVLLRGNWFEVLGVDTEPVATEVVNVQALWDRADE